MKTKEVIELYQQLTNLRDSRSEALPFQVAYAITRDIKLLEPIAKDFEEVRQQICLAYGSVNDEGNIVVPADKVSDANKEIADLLEMSNPVDLVKVKASSLENLDFSLKDMEAMYSIILGEE